MKFRLLPLILLSLPLSALYAQDAPPSAQDTGNGPTAGSVHRFGRGGFGGGMGMGNGFIGTVTDVAADHYAVKNETGEIYTVHFSVNTRIMKQVTSMRAAGGRGPGQGMVGGEGRGGGGMGRGGNPPEPIKPTDIKVGDAVAAMGEVDAAAKSVGAVVILQLDPERAKQIEQMRANYGKTWLMGKVTAVDGVKVTLLGSIDNAPHDFIADENTAFRKRRDPVTLADIQIGDMVRAEGALKDGTFAAATVNIMNMPQEGTPRIPRPAPPQ